MVSKPPPLKRSSRKQAPAVHEETEQVAPPGEGHDRLEELKQPEIDDRLEKAEALEPEEALEEEALEALEELEEHSRFMRFFYSFGSCGISLLIHLVGLLLLAYLTVPAHVRNVPALVEAMFDPRTEDDPVEFELDTEIQYRLR
jgi:hypothetical protein